MLLPALVALLMWAVARPARAADRDTLAWVGAHAITAGELLRRIDLMPWPEKNGRVAPDSIRWHALESLMGETLLADAAEARGLGRDPRIVRMRRALEKALARDALYRSMFPTGTAAAHAAAARDTMARLLAARRVVVERAPFFALADSLRGLLAEDPAARLRNGRYRVSADDSDVLLARLAPRLDQPLARLADGPLTLGDAIEEFRFRRWSMSTLAPARFRVEFSRALRELIEGEVMSREALRRGLARRVEVRRELASWTRAWEAQALARRLVADAPNGEARVERLARVIADAATRTRIAIDAGALQRVTPTPTPVLTRRYLGFGGEMLAAPTLPPLWRWAELWRSARTPLP